MNIFRLRNGAEKRVGTLIASQLLGLLGIGLLAFLLGVGPGEWVRPSIVLALPCQFDQDCDTIPDDLDRDDDNDGIIDEQEGYVDATLDPTTLTKFIDGVDQTGNDVVLTETSVISYPNALRFAGNDLDLVVTLLEFRNIVSGTVRSDADGGLSVEEMPSNDPFIRFSLQFLESGSTVPAPINAAVSFDIGDIDSTTGRDFTDLFGVEAGSVPTLSFGANLEASGFSNGPNPAGFDYFRVDPASAGGPTEWLAEPDATEDDLNHTVSVSYDSFLSSEYFLGATGSYDGPISSTLDFRNFTIFQSLDTDGDQVEDRFDLDSDNDGISDLFESGHYTAALDSDRNGMLDSAVIGDEGLFNGVPASSLYATGVYAVDQPPIDTDGIGSENLPDYLDLDADNDGIPDTVEARPTGNYQINDGNVTNNDLDQDGVIDLFDANDGPAGELGGTFSQPVQTDGQTADFLNTDSDGDGLNDGPESGLILNNSDNNRDGLDDALNGSYADPDGIVNNPSLDLSNQVGDTSEVAYREGPPAVTLADISVTEGETGTVTVTLSGEIDTAVDVTIGTADGTATAGADYQAGPYIATIPAGQLTGTTLIPTLADSSDEPNETFQLTINATAGGSVGDTTDTATVTIIDVNTPPDISVGDIAVTEGSSATVTISLSQSSSEAITLTVQTVADTATSGVDYVPGPYTLRLPPATLSGTVAINTLDDNIDEPNETLTVTVANSSGGAVGSSSDTGVVTILDNDGVPNVTLGPSTVIEGLDAGVPITISPAAAQPLTLTFVTTDITALEAADYGAGPYQLTVPANSVTATLPITTAADLINEGNETFSLSLVLTDSLNYTSTTPSAIVTILDDDQPPLVSLGTVTVTEGITALLPIDLSNPSTNPITISVSLTNSALLPLIDLDPGPYTVTLPAGSLTGTLPISTATDLLIEPTERFSATATLIGGGPISATVQSGAVVLLDGNGAPVINIGTVTVTEGLTAALPISLSLPSTEPLTLTVTLTDGTDLPLSDLFGGPYTITMPANSPTATLPITTFDDLLNEGTEPFTVTAELATGAAVTGTPPMSYTVNPGLLLITDNDLPPQLSIGSATVTEGLTITLPISLSAPSGRPIDLTLVVTNSTGTAVNDVARATYTTTLPTGSITGTLLISTVNDSWHELTETFTVTAVLSDSGAISPTVNAGALTILDNDPRPLLSIGTITVTEGISSPLPLALSNASGQPLTLTLALTGTEPAADFAGSRLTVTIPAESPTTTVTLLALDDLIDEPLERYTVTLESFSGGPISDTVEPGIVEIIDNDDPPSVHLADTLVTEGLTATVPLTLSNPSAAPLTVTVVTTDKTALNPVDYSGGQFDILIEPGVTQTQVIIPTTLDQTIEPVETFEISIVALTGGPATIGTGTATVSITEDSDGDGVPNGIDLDDDNDGLLDSDEGGSMVDRDQDGIPNRLDRDSDNDGRYDLAESGLPPSTLTLIDSNGDGQIDADESFGPNGMADQLETDPESGVSDYNGDRLPDLPADTDGDAVFDFIDLDSDNDGINDVIEGGNADQDNDGIIQNGRPMVNFAGLVINANFALLDSDGDGIPNQRDRDSDNDGISDLLESCLPIVDGPTCPSDPNNNGVIGTGKPIVNIDGQPVGGVGSAVADSDGDGIPDFLDHNSDGDEIDDVIEAGFADLDGNGQVGRDVPPIDLFGSPIGTTGLGALPLDIDGNGIPDFQEVGPEITPPSQQRTLFMPIISR